MRGTSPDAEISREVMLSIFWNYRGVILTDYLEKSQSITSDYYPTLLYKRSSSRNGARSYAHVHPSILWGPLIWNRLETGGWEKTQRLDTCKPRTPSVIRGVRKKLPHRKTKEWREIP
ncbi:hypothetical protein TNCV_2981871 [Trichonephila clavipes]|nr:hypothetical protein TNCV_2981871 [Trichonephila clavipes]